MRLGAEIVMMPRFVLREAMKLIQTTKPTVMPGVPTMFVAMLGHPNLANFDLSSLKYCVSGGAPLPIEVKQRFEALTGCRVVEGYGLSEASPVVTCNPPDGPVKPGSIGQPLPGTVVSLRDLADSTKEVAPGEKGEICVKGPQVMMGYWRRPEETAASFRDGWFRTGDVAVLDDGQYRLLGRTSVDIIKTGGYKVSALEIEEVLRAHPAVEDCAVVGLADEEWGERVAAAVVARGATTAPSLEELRGFAKDRLAPYKAPREVVVVTALPRNTLGKVEKPRVKEMFDR